jgi:hypothetical protein
MNGRIAQWGWSTGHWSSTNWKWFTASFRWETDLLVTYVANGLWPASMSWAIWHSTMGYSRCSVKKSQQHREWYRSRQAVCCHDCRNNAEPWPLVWGKGGHHERTGRSVYKMWGYTHEKEERLIFMIEQRIPWWCLKFSDNFSIAQHAIELEGSPDLYW